MVLTCLDSQDIAQELAIKEIEIGGYNSWFERSRDKIDIVRKMRWLKYEVFCDYDIADIPEKYELILEKTFISEVLHGQTREAALLILEGYTVTDVKQLLSITEGNWKLMKIRMRQAYENFYIKGV